MKMYKTKKKDKIKQKVFIDNKENMIHSLNKKKKKKKKKKKTTTTKKTTTNKQKQINKTT